MANATTAYTHRKRNKKLIGLRAVRALPLTACFFTYPIDKKGYILMNYRRLRPRLQNRISPWDESARFETKTASDRALSFSVRKKLHPAVSCRFLKYGVNLSKHRKKRKIPIFIPFARFEPRTAQAGRFAYECKNRQFPSKIVRHIPHCRSPPLLSNFKKNSIGGT